VAPLQSARVCAGHPRTGQPHARPTQDGTVATPLAGDGLPWPGPCPCPCPCFGRCPAWELRGCSGPGRRCRGRRGEAQSNSRGGNARGWVGPKQRRPGRGRGGGGRGQAPDHLPAPLRPMLWPSLLGARGPQGTRPCGRSSEGSSALSRHPRFLRCPGCSGLPGGPKQARARRRGIRDATRKWQAEAPGAPGTLEQEPPGAGGPSAAEAVGEVEDRGAAAGAEGGSLDSAQRSQEAAAAPHCALSSLPEDAAAPKTEQHTEDAASPMPGQADGPILPRSPALEGLPAEPAPEEAAEDGARGSGADGGVRDSGAEGGARDSSAESRGRDSSAGDSRSPHSGVHIELLTAAELVRGAMPAPEVEALLRKSRMGGPLLRTVSDLLLEGARPPPGWARPEQAGGSGTF